MAVTDKDANSLSEHQKEETKAELPTSTAAQVTIAEFEDEFEGDEYLRHLLAGDLAETTKEIDNLQLDNYDQKSWKTLDSVHSNNALHNSNNSSFGELNDSCASFASFGGGHDSDSTLGESFSEIKANFTNLDYNSGPTASSLLLQTPKTTTLSSATLGTTTPSSCLNATNNNNSLNVPQHQRQLPQQRGILSRSTSQRMPKRAPSFRGYLTLIKENSLH